MDDYDWKVPMRLPSPARSRVVRPHDGAHISIRGLLDSGLKRALDLAISAALLVLLAPVFVALAILIRLESPGPAFYRCSRVGRNGERLAMLKFRKMHHGATGPALTTAHDRRFTRVGRFLAKTKLDELPQLWHVVRGEMSLVGPRPEDAEFVDCHWSEYSRILTVRPGITGLSQLAFADESAILDDGAPLDHYLENLLPQKVGIDHMYASRRTVWMDVRILFWTAVAVLLRRQVAVDRRSGRLRVRRR